MWGEVVHQGNPWRRKLPLLHPLHSQAEGRDNGSPGKIWAPVMKWCLLLPALREW